MKLQKNPLFKNFTEVLRDYPQVVKDLTKEIHEVRENLKLDNYPLACDTNSIKVQVLCRMFCKLPQDMSDDIIGMLISYLLSSSYGCD